MKQLKLIKASREQCNAANGPDSCRYHGPFRKLQKAVEQNDYTAYEKARKNVDRVQRTNPAEGDSEYGTDGDSGFIITTDDLNFLQNTHIAGVENGVQGLVSRIQHQNTRNRAYLKSGYWKGESGELAALLIVEHDRLVEEADRETVPEEKARKALEANEYYRVSNRLFDEHTTDDGVLDEDQVATSLDHAEKSAAAAIVDTRGWGGFFKETLPESQKLTNLQLKARVNAVRRIRHLILSSYDNPEWGTFMEKATLKV